MPKNKNTEPMTTVGVKISLYNRIINLSELTGKKIFFLLDEAFTLLEKQYAKEK
jgi:hypothetical protein